MIQYLVFILLAWPACLKKCDEVPPPWKLDRPIVDVPGKGRVIGVEVQANNLTYFGFRGIPYAEPPIGQLRFKDPVASEGWKGDLDAAEFPPVCTQSGKIPEGQEDCLYLSIYTPQEAIYNDEPMAVMVFIHGGFFLDGSMRTYTPSPLIQKDVIVVTLQYRLGVLGFLSTEDSIAPGNLGLKDQTMALRWIKENVASFGGDPDRITLFGESAGSYSVHYQLLVPSAEGLFHGAIMQSGTAICPGAHGRNYLKDAQEIARGYGCPETPSEYLIICLQNQTARSLISYNHGFDEWHKHPKIFAPRVDGSFIPAEPLTLLKEKRYTKVPVIIGTNKDEGALYSIDWYAYPSVLRSLLDNFEVNGPISLELLPEEDPYDTTLKVYYQYLPGIIIGKEQADNATLMNGHRFYHIPVDWTVELMASDVSVFMYELQHRGQHGLMDIYLDLGLPLPQAANWVSHTDDLQYLFDWLPLEEEEDLAVREVFTNTWSNFAKTLNPTPDESLGYKWDKVGTTELQHLSILPSPHMEEDNRFIDRQFWNSLPLKENPYK